MIYEERINELKQAKERMIDYLKLKVTEQDWHAVCDAANDIREIESALNTLLTVH